MCSCRCHDGFIFYFYFICSHVSETVEAAVSLKTRMRFVSYAALDLSQEVLNLLPG